MERLNILIVDDELGMRQGVARALRDFTVSLPDVNGEVDFAVEQAESAEQAFELLNTTPADIILLDYKLPGMSGLEMLDRVKAQHAETLVVMITAYASLETAVSAVKRGAYDFIAKPFTPQELKDTIRKTAGRLILARQARRLAQEKRRVRFEFISVLAHELKAPVGAVEGYLNILKERTAGDDPATYENMVDRCIARIGGMRKMIADLLDLTRIESGQKKREPVEVELLEVANTAAATFLPEAAARGISIDIEGGPPVALLADRGEMEIILNNLVSNAVKYNRDGGSVRVSIRRANGSVVIEVSDTGIGMTSEDAARLFNDFVRIKNEKTRNILGSGLGLSILKKLAAFYGGDVSVTSEPDVGSTFRVELNKPVEDDGGN